MLFNSLNNGTAISSNAIFMEAHIHTRGGGGEKEENSVLVQDSRTICTAKMAILQVKLEDKHLTTGRKEENRKQHWLTLLAPWTLPVMKIVVLLC